MNEAATLHGQFQSQTKESLHNMTHTLHARSCQLIRYHENPKP